jgi:L-ascorbate metabolism protein UlaG (beta-lactamase superfamily)
MRITRFGHSCVLVEDGGGRVLLDPGSFSAGFEHLRGLTAVLITHAHHDHLDLPRLEALLDANPDARLHVDEGSAAQVAGLSPTVVNAGDALDVGTRVRVFGSEHAVIHPDLPRIPNVGYLVGERFFTPGDALTRPEADVEVLGLPTAAPWLKLSEAVELYRGIAPRRAFPVHDAVLAQPQIWYGHFERLGPDGAAFEVVALDGALDVP